MDGLLVTGVCILLFTIGMALLFLRELANFGRMNEVVLSLPFLLLSICTGAVLKMNTTPAITWV